MHKILYKHSVIICVVLAIAHSHRVSSMDAFRNTMQGLNSCINAYPAMTACGGIALAIGLCNDGLAYQKGADYVIRNRMKPLPITLAIAAASMYTYHKHVRAQPHNNLRAKSKALVTSPYITQLTFALFNHFFIYPYLLQNGWAGPSVNKRHVITTFALVIATLCAEKYVPARFKNGTAPIPSVAITDQVTSELPKTTNSKRSERIPIVDPDSNNKNENLHYTIFIKHNEVVVVHKDNRTQCRYSLDTPAPDDLPQEERERYTRLQKNHLSQREVILNHDVNNFTNNNTQTTRPLSSIANVTLPGIRSL